MTKSSWPFKQLARALCVAVSMYTVIPVPRFEWTPDNLRDSLCFLPVAGAIVGFFLWLWASLCAYIGAGNVLFAAGATILPILITGGIHMDGFCDTVDAFSSHRERAAMLDILKDSHTGAFAVIYTAVYLLTVFGLYTEVSRGDCKIIGAGFVLSRTVAAISAVSIPKARKDGLLYAFSRYAAPARVMITMFILLAAVLAFMALESVFAAALCFLCAGVVLLAYRAFMLKHLGGVTGDTSGFLTQCLELSILIAVVSIRLFHQII